MLDWHMISVLLVVGEIKEDLDSGRIWTVCVHYVWMTSFHRRHHKIISYEKPFLTTSFMELILQFLKFGHIFLDFVSLK